MNRKPRFWMAVLALALFFLNVPLFASDPKPLRIVFTGYQQLNGIYLFQFRFDNVPADQQPPLKRTGNLVGRGGYVVGAFHQVFKMEPLPGSGTEVNTDESVVEIDNPDTGQKVMVPFRRAIDLPK